MRIKCVRCQICLGSSHLWLWTLLVGVDDDRPLGGGDGEARLGVAELDDAAGLAAEGAAERRLGGEVDLSDAHLSHL